MENECVNSRTDRSFPSVCALIVPIVLAGLFGPFVQPVTQAVAGERASPRHRDGDTVTGTAVDGILRRRYAPTARRIVNPERGFYEWVELVNADGTPGDFTAFNASELSLAFSYLRLDSFVDRAISDAYLSALDTALEGVAASGFKLILRVAYRFPGETGTDRDADVSRMRQHIVQLKPVLRRHRGVIAVVQAGMLGDWGEWHGMGEELDTAEVRRQVLEFALDMTPPDRSVQLRSPADIVALFPDGDAVGNGSGSPAQRRVGHHNDCFLSSADDVGTYFPPERAIALRHRVRQIGEYAPVGGETCLHALEDGRTGCADAVAELRRFRWSFLNRAFYRPVIERWREEGCLAIIEAHLGYRYALSAVDVTAAAPAGQALSLDITLTNEGYAGLYNARKARLILRSEHGVQSVASLRPVETSPQGDRDVRQWLPAPGDSRTQRFASSLPIDLPAGTYRLLLHLPDADPRLAADPRYAVQLANEGVWEARTGYNDLGLAVQVLASSSR